MRRFRKAVEIGGSAVWDQKKPLPPAIASLKPQFISLSKGTVTVLCLQVSGGFQHTGYLVVCDDDAGSFTPDYGPGWVRKKLADFVFYYDE